jgi:alpha-mannosidase
MFDAWDIESYYQEKMKELKDVSSIEMIESGSLRTVIRFKWKYARSTIQQDMCLYAHNRRIDFKTYIDWKEKQQLLKAAFPVDVRSTEATFDVQFGNVKRPTHWNTSWDFARFETVGHQWADFSEGGYGVSLLNDCKYGYDIKDNVMRLTLLKSAIMPDAQADKTEHHFTYSLLPHSGGWVEANTVQEAWKVNHSLRVQKGAPQADDSFSLFHSASQNVMIDAVKKAEDSSKMVLRLHEYQGIRGKIQLDSDLSVLSWQECDLMEKPTGELHSSDSLSFELKPYEIKTFLIDLKGAGAY